MGRVQENQVLDIEIKMHSSWLAALLDEFDKPYMCKLYSFLEEEIKQNRTFTPPAPLIFAELQRVSISDVKKVILSTSYKSEISENILFLHPTFTSFIHSEVNTHQDKGWERFVGVILRILNESTTPIEFCLIGANVKSFKKYINNKKHKVKVRNV